MEHRDPGPDTADRPVAALRDLLNAWDPIGVVADGGPQDEYDCLIAPMLDELSSGAGPAGLAAFLRRELDEHFGLSPEHVAGIEAVARRAAELRGTSS